MCSVTNTKRKPNIICRFLKIGHHRGLIALTKWVFIHDNISSQKCYNVEHAKSR